jgi:hypothetical protein
MAVPVQTCCLNPAASLFYPRFRMRVGTVFLSPAMEALRQGQGATDVDVDRTAIVLMAGIAAEALANGNAEGGAADERALRTLLVAHYGSEEHELRARARWAVASATLLLRQHSQNYDALCKALGEGRSVGECVLALEMSD